MEEHITFESEADEHIWSCCDLESPKSFFLFAGAGSGKTRSLINALDLIRKKYGSYLRIKKKKICVITYTNAACEEIKHRLKYDSHFSVSTIHSFAWDLIKHFQKDIKQWVVDSTWQDIKKIELEVAKGRPGTKAALDRINRLERKKNRIQTIDQIKEFVYSPTGDNASRDSLNHTEVIHLTASFLSKPLMQQVVVQKFPVLFIDESQDTNKELIDALFILQSNHSSTFLLGLFGDVMQRIYNDGKPQIEKALPGNWVKPLKSINYRSPKRIINLINKIRSAVDDKLQIPKDGQLEGHVRVFIASENQNKVTFEDEVIKKMRSITLDDNWTTMDSNVKILILEHHMAARRMGFLNLFTSLYEAESMRNGLLDGTSSSIRFFTKLILPLIKASKRNDKFRVAHIVKEHSGFFVKRKSKIDFEKTNTLKQANEGVESLLNLWKNESIPTLIEIINNVGASGIFPLPETFEIIHARSINSGSISEIESQDAVEQEVERTPTVLAWDKALTCSFSEIEKYNEYISENPRFGTQQGVKGLEFDRVMVIIDDAEARGFSFNYSKLFTEVVASSITGSLLKNETEETSIDRTRRLFYVACSRARKSLAIVAYSSDPTSLRQSLIEKAWFFPEEIIVD